MGNMNRTDSNPAHRDPRPVNPVHARSVRLRAARSIRACTTSTGGKRLRASPITATDYTYDDYAPAYRTGYEAAGRYHGENRRFDELEPELRANYERIKGSPGWPGKTPRMPFGPPGIASNGSCRATSTTTVADRQESTT